MRAICKVTSLRLNVFIGTLTTGLLTSVLLPAILLWSGCANAQVTIDGTTNTTINQSGNNFTILNGSRNGSNLFHSFGEFSVPTGGSATFNLVNTPNVTNIFSRVTGGNISNIDGLIRTLNSSNPVSLFLMNPNGIIFGQNAKLDISGSFVGSTASSLKFADGSEFSATNPNTTLLTISVPIGLQMGSNPGAIAVNTTSGLSVKTDRTLALLGGDVEIAGGRLKAPNGGIELGSVAPKSFVTLTSTQPGWTFDYAGVQNFQNIALTQAAKLDTSGSSSGFVQIQGRQVSLKDGSSITANTIGNNSGKGITIRASELLAVMGVTPDAKTPTNITSSVQSGAKGRGGDITIETPKLDISDGAEIKTNTYGAGNGGNLSIKATEVDIQGRDTLLKNTSQLVSQVESKATGRGGNVTIEAESVRIRDGAAIKLRTLSSGDDGNLFIRATDVVLQGRTSKGSRTDVSANSREDATGKGGAITIEAERVLLDGATLRAKTYNEGQAGNITVRATEMTVVDTQITTESDSKTAISIGGDIRLEVESLRFLNGGRATASASGQGRAGNIFITAQSVELAGKSPEGTPIEQQGLSSLEARSEGQAAAGSVNIFTNSLLVRDEAIISVSNTNSGDAGNLLIQANDLRLDNRASLRAEVNAGKQGNITINANLLMLRHGSNITTRASGTASGGNINLNTGLLIGLENSDIIANATKGSGGNIQITTQGIFGLKFQEQLTRENDITASSQFGVNGTVDINNFGVDPSSGLVELPVNLVDSSKLIATGCSANQDSSFVATGRGGVPQNPLQQVWSDRTWSDTRDISAYRKTGNVTAQILTSAQTLVPATSWHRNPDGKVELIADKSSVQLQPTLACTGISR
jgi:filamentous hemagglutinin family protein